METYRPGDKVCLFGFSRGAYAARYDPSTCSIHLMTDTLFHNRALAGMLFRVGLLPSRNFELAPLAYKIFAQALIEDGIRRKDPKDKRGYLSRNFRATFSREVPIEFIGLW